LRAPFLRDFTDLNPKKPPTDNLNLRLAVAYAINPEPIIFGSGSSTEAWSSINWFPT
jgi:ABC-type transport system substrate-binding protein